MLYFTLVIPKLEYASVIRNCITSADANKLEDIQRKFVALFYIRFFPNAHANELRVSYVTAYLTREKASSLCRILY
jgi:hypothetical protein